MVLTEFLVKIAAEATLISMGIEGISRVTGIHFFRIMFFFLYKYIKIKSIVLVKYQIQLLEILQKDF